MNRLLPDLGYKDSQIQTKKSIASLTVGRGSKKEKYKPDYVLLFHGLPRCVIDAKSIDESIDNWIEQCSGYCLALNRKFQNQNPVRYFLLSNGKTTSVYEWDKDSPILTLDFSDFTFGNQKFDHLKSILNYRNIAISSADPLPLDKKTFTLSKPTSAKARQLFAICHKVIWKSEGIAPGPAFLEFVKLMFVKLWADKNIRNNPTVRPLFVSGAASVDVPLSLVTFSENWIEQQKEHGQPNPINNLFINLRDEIERDIQVRRKKRIFAKDERLDLRPDTIKDIVQRLQHVDLYGIDDDLNGRLFETFLNATMRGRDLGQFFTPRSVVNMMTFIADLKVSRESQDKVADFCCGSGGFLIEALTVMRNKVRNNPSFSLKEKDALIDRIANECIYGIDFGKNPPLARIARINMYLHGDGGSRIYYADALDKDLDFTAQGDPEVIQNIDELRNALLNTRLNVILTNPPFAMNKESKNPTEKRILQQYDLARRDATSTGLKPSLRSSVMFIERYCEVLEAGGKLISVIDDTLLSSKKFSFVRDYIRKHFLIRAIISLPGDTFRRSGSRVKTSVLILEKKRLIEDSQPNWYYFFSQYLGIDDLTPKASEKDCEDARMLAEKETRNIIDGYRNYLEGKETDNVLGPDRIVDRLDLRSCVPLLGRKVPNWRKMGIEIKRLEQVVNPVESSICPEDFPDKQFKLIKVSYEGRCELEDTKIGSRVRSPKMFQVKAGQIVFSTIRATDGAIGIVPPELDGALVSESSYTVFECNTPEDSAYLWSILRSHELRADMQSLSPGSGRYTTPWPDVGKIQIPWLSNKERQSVGEKLIEVWNSESQIKLRKAEAMSHTDMLEIETEDSVHRWKISKAPQ